jgi:putative transposase
MRCTKCGSEAVTQRPERTAAHDQVNNLFHLRRDHVTAAEYRRVRARAFAIWAEITDVAAAA